MALLPHTENALVVRTGFGDDKAWEKVCDMIRQPVGIYRFRAYVHFVDDPAFADLETDQLLAHIPGDFNHTFIIVADKTTFTHPGHPLLVVDVYHQPGRSFRASPQAIQAIENNLSIANMDYEDFAGSVGRDGIFREFPRP